MSESAFDTPELEDTPEVSDTSEAVEELKKRNSGLQRKLQEVLAERDALKARSPGKPEAKREDMPEEVTNDLQNVLEGMASEIISLRLDKWRSAALKKYPEAEKFADMLDGDTEEAVLNRAKEIATRLGHKETPEGETEEETEEANVTTSSTPNVPVNAGSPALPPEPNEGEEMAALKKEARESGNWSSLLQRMRERAAAG